MLLTKSGQHTGNVTRRVVFVLASLASCIIVPYQFSFTHTATIWGSVLLYALDFIILVKIIRENWLGRDGRIIENSSHFLVTPHSRNLSPLDIVAAVPIDIFFLPFVAFEISGISVVLYLRLFRLLRVRWIYDLLRALLDEGQITSHNLRMGKMAVTVILLLHWVSCTWYLVPFINGFPTDSWATVQGLEHASGATSYLRALYWSVVTFTTVGFGDITPQSNSEYLLAIFLIPLGATMYAYIIANIASIVRGADSRRARYWDKYDSINSYLGAKGLTDELGTQLRSHYEYTWAKYNGVDEKELLSDLPNKLRLKIMQHLAKNLIDNVPLLKLADEPLRNELLAGMVLQTIQPTEYIVKEGEIADGIYFISQGDVSLVSIEKSKTFGTLRAGDYFGDLSLILNERRTASAKAVSLCEIFFLPKNEFDRIKSNYKDLKIILTKISSQESGIRSEWILENVIL